jgi:hypothetical protein
MQFCAWAEKSVNVGWATLSCPPKIPNITHKKTTQPTKDWMVGVQFNGSYNVRVGSKALPTLPDYLQI